MTPTQAALAASLAESTKRYDREQTDLERQRLRSNADHARRVKDANARADAVAQKINAEIVATLGAALDPIVVAWHKEPTRELCAAFSAACSGPIAQCRAELGVELDLPRHLGMAFARHAIAARPTAINSFGLPDAWACSFGGGRLFEIGDRAAVAIIDGASALILGELSELERAVARVAVSDRTEVVQPYARERFAVLQRGADRGSVSRSLEKFEIEWRAEDQRQKAQEYAQLITNMRAARRGERVPGMAAALWEKARDFIGDHPLLGPLSGLSRAVVTEPDDKPGVMPGNTGAA